MCGFFIFFLQNSFISIIILPCEYENLPSRNNITHLTIPSRNNIIHLTIPLKSYTSYLWMPITYVDFIMPGARSSAAIALERNLQVASGFPSQRVSSMDVWCFFDISSKKIVEQTLEWPLICDTMTPMWLLWGCFQICCLIKFSLIWPLLLIWFNFNPSMDMKLPGIAWLCAFRLLAH